MASRNRWWRSVRWDAPSGAVLRAVALVFLVLIAPIGSVGDYARADRPPVEVADGNHPRTDVQPTGTIERLHAAGVTGDDVTVGVLDVSGFDTGNPALAGQVADSRSFGQGEEVPNLGRTAHGTATASIIANVAPDAEFYLASFRTPEGYHEAFNWLLQNDVDVIVVPVSFYGQPRTSKSVIAQTTRRAAKHGTTVIAPAGNIANSYWRGEYRPDSRGRLLFNGDPQNHLVGNSSRVTVWLSWSGPSDVDFTLELYREGREDPVATSENYTMDGERNERLTTRIDPDGSYYLHVRGPLISGPTRVTIESPTHTFQHGYRHGSVTQPAVPDDVIAVGAYDVGRGKVAPYSSAGPVNRNPGVDVLGPTNLVAPGYPGGFEGTSSSAAYVGGLAALIYDVDPDTTPGHVESLLERTASDVGRTGPDTVSGYGVVEPDRLIRLTRNESTPRRSADSSS